MKYDILVNESHPFNKDYLNNVNFVYVKDFNGKDLIIEKETYDNYLKFSAYLLRRKIYVTPISAYRSYDEQMMLYSQNSNLSKPGCSDHHTGLAIDLAIKIGDNYITDHKMFLAEVKAVKKITKKARKFGFIVRYPANKKDITHHEFSPWHIRYVGVSLAKKLYRKKTTLEEYYNDKYFAQ